ncbi:hypothetical protein NDA11_000225 [Ustilago hordei]|uniref:HD/PDEase domain-containing protein n=1 Tax=Ustilago hordei TaxID=120017 RepID=I2G083_USTHO|nr:uncharacterized protein UHO2_03630 [Ustilago hordei]KAJ1044133.1 hypothetical protein NDA10_006695 [Ustilago hordei]KAJ1581291.1 hypothetical protein NDA11_000225 [Ustilago hordei]CCF52576.1 uncharacterized protein UHOR_04689 [Ustilago hordei]SYW75236.1 uncharacterized protein UHO2_03630 [Ustilago hordei]
MNDLTSGLASSSPTTSAPAPKLTSSQRTTIISAAESFVKTAFANHDPSHDYHHVNRVRLLALSLTRSSELTPLDLLVVELGALFHDLTDSKYSSSSLDPSTVLAPFWASLPTPSPISETQRVTVEKIVENVSWSKDERRRTLSPSHRTSADIALSEWLESCKEFQVISDADRLDSIGSIGIMRCAAYSAKVGRTLYVPPANAKMDPNPPAEQGEGWNGSAVGHFYEKLLRIRGDRLYTTEGRREAERRQGVMENFLEELGLEWVVAKQGAEIAMMRLEEEDEDDEEESEDLPHPFGSAMRTMHFVQHTTTESNIHTTEPRTELNDLY